MYKNWKRVLLLTAATTLMLIWLFPWPLPGHVAARIDGEDITQAALDVFVAAARRGQQQIDRNAILEGLVENRLLSNLRRYQGNQWAASQVGYTREALEEQQLFRLIRSAYSEALEKSMKASGSNDSLDFLTRPLKLNKSRLTPLLQLEQALYSTMTPAQAALAKKFVLANYRFRNDQPEQSVTLWDLYQRQNMQLKVQMHNLNLEFIREALKQYLTTAYVIDWFAHRANLDPESREIVRRCVRDALDRESQLHQMGLLQDMHDDNPQLRRLAEQVSAAEISAYYEAHREQFTRVEQVHAYHIRLDSQEKADRVFAELQAGLPFADAVKRYSNANDKDKGGALGWINRENRQSHWHRALAFVQPPNQISRPFRSPQNTRPVYWEILLVDKRETGFQPLASESVRYRASIAIAREKLQAQFQDRLAAARRAASIKINRRLACASC